MNQGASDPNDIVADRRVFPWREPCHPLSRDDTLDYMNRLAVAGLAVFVAYVGGLLGSFVPLFVGGSGEGFDAGWVILYLVVATPLALIASGILFSVWLIGVYRRRS